MKIKGIIFDYGGTIDSNGMHWAEVIWRAYQANRMRMYMANGRWGSIQSYSHTTISWICYA